MIYVLRETYLQVVAIHGRYDSQLQSGATGLYELDHLLMRVPLDIYASYFDYEISLLDSAQLEREKYGLQSKWK